MFYRYASNLLKNISNECMLKSFASKDEDISSMYNKIAIKIENLIRRMGVESPKENINEFVE